MNWDDLRIFLAASRAQSLAETARTLGIDPTTVGRRLERLSQTMNSALFESGTGGFILTTHGERLRAFAESAEHSIMEASGTLTGERSRLAGTVRISLSEGLATSLVAPSLPQFRERHPDITLEIVSTNGFLNPSKREADLAIMLARPARGPLIARKLTDYSLGLYASPPYLASHGTPTRTAELRHHTLIGYIPDFIYAEELRYLSEIEDGLEPELSSSSINVQHAMTRSGAGISVLPHFIGRSDASLTPVLPDTVSIQRSFWIVVHRDIRRIARVAAVIDWLDQLAAQHQPMLRNERQVCG